MAERNKVYLKILKTIKPLMPTISQSHLVTMAMMMTGLVLGRRGQLSAMSREVASQAKDASIEKRFARFVQDERVDGDLIMMPFVEQIIASLRHQTLYVVIDSSTIGRSCRVSLVSVVYQQRALPIGWVVYKGRKGHAMVEYHQAALALVAPLLAAHPQVVFLGDAEFDTIDLLFWIHEQTSWRLIVRTSPNSAITTATGQIAIRELIEKPGDFCAITHGAFTDRELPNILALANWQIGFDKPLYLISTINENPWAVCQRYAHRFKIETFFSDQKSRGFHLHKSHISDPTRLERLLLPACLTYLWLVFLGVEVILDENKRQWVDRTHRRDKSLFRLGCDWLKNALKRQLSFDVFFTPPVLGQFVQVPVR